MSCGCLKAVCLKWTSSTMSKILTNLLLTLDYLTSLKASLTHPGPLGWHRTAICVFLPHFPSSVTQCLNVFLITKSSIVIFSYPSAYNPGPCLLLTALLRQVTDQRLSLWIPHPHHHYLFMPHITAQLISLKHRSVLSFPCSKPTAVISLPRE